MPYLSLLPQFVDLKAAAALQSLALGSTQIIVSVAINIPIAIMAGSRNTVPLSAFERGLKEGRLRKSGLRRFCDRSLLRSTVRAKDHGRHARRSRRSAHSSGIPALRRPSYDRSFISRKRGSRALGRIWYAFHAAIVLNGAVEGSAR